MKNNVKLLSKLEHIYNLKSKDGIYLKGNDSIYLKSKDNIYLKSKYSTYLLFMMKRNVL